MSLIFTADLQAAIYQRLAGDPRLASLIGTAIFDAPLKLADGMAPDHITLGEETVRPFDTKTSAGARHDFVVSVHSGKDGFHTAKQIASAVYTSLLDAPLTLGMGKIVDLRFLRAQAERGPAPEKRKIALRFRAVIDQDD